MQHFKFVNWGIWEFYFWCHEQVNSSDYWLAWLRTKIWVSQFLRKIGPLFSIWFSAAEKRTIFPDCHPHFPRLKKEKQIIFLNYCPQLFRDFFQEFQSYKPNCQFLFRWIYYCLSGKSTGKKGWQNAPLCSPTVLHFWTELFIQIHFSSLHCTEVRFASSFAGGFTTMAEINSPDRKLAKRTSVHCGDLV